MSFERNPGSWPQSGHDKLVGCHDLRNHRRLRAMEAGAPHLEFALSTISFNPVDSHFPVYVSRISCARNPYRSSDHVLPGRTACSFLPSHHLRDRHVRFRSSVMERLSIPPDAHNRNRYHDHLQRVERSDFPTVRLSRSPHGFGPTVSDLEKQITGSSVDDYAHHLYLCCRLLDMVRLDFQGYAPVLAFLIIHHCVSVHDRSLAEVSARPTSRCLTQNFLNPVLWKHGAGLNIAQINYLIIRQTIVCQFPRLLYQFVKHQIMVWGGVLDHTNPIHHTYLAPTFSALHFSNQQ